MKVIRTNERIQEALEALGLSTDMANVEQLREFARAMDIYQERTARRGNLWARRGMRGALVQMDSKMLRLMADFWERDPRTYTPVPDEVDGPDGIEWPDEDDAVDLLNYTAFFLRCYNHSNLTGKEHS